MAGLLLAVLNSYMVHFMQALREREGYAPHDLDLSQPTVRARAD